MDKCNNNRFLSILFPLKSIALQPGNVFQVLKDKQLLPKLERFEENN